jgi:hypothetical protein
VLLIVQYKKLSLTNCKSTDSYTADCGSMRATNCQLVTSSCHLLPFRSEYSPQIWFQMLSPFVFNLGWTLTFKTLRTPVIFWCIKPLSVCFYGNNCWLNRNTSYFLEHCFPNFFLHYPKPLIRKSFLPNVGKTLIAQKTYLTSEERSVRNRKQKICLMQCLYFKHL